MNTEKRKNIDEILGVYGSRKAPYTFRFKGEKKVMTRKRRFRPALAISCTACLLVCAVLGVGLFANNFFKQDKMSDFVLSVSAAEQEIVISDEPALTKPVINISETAYLFHVDGSNITEKNPLEAGGKTVSRTLTIMSVDTLTFKIQGEKIKSFDISSENGMLDYFDYAKYEDTGNKSDSLFMGSSFDNLKPFDEEDENRYVVGWCPDIEKFNESLREVTGGFDRYTKDPDMNVLEKLSEGYRTLLKNADDLTKHFGDTVTVNLHYTDGTEESVNIVITLDEYGYARVWYDCVEGNLNVY